MGQGVYQTKEQGVNDLRHHLTDLYVGVEPSVAVEQSVIDDGIDHWRSHLHACIRVTGRHFEYSLRHILAESLVTVRNEVKIYS